MKRQVLATVLLSVLASSAFALPAAEQAIPQNKAQTVQTSQTVARSGSQEQENRDYAKGAVAENGSDRTNIVTDGVAESGSDRTNIVTDGVAENGSDRTNIVTDGVAENGSDRTNIVTDGLAEGGSDRLKEMHEAQS